MKVIFIASVYRHLTAFHIPYIKYFQNYGAKVYAAGMGIDDKLILEEMGVTCIDIPIARNPLKLTNIKANRELKKLFTENEFDLIHVHTPVTALLARMAHRNVAKGKIIYTAHGFHFFKGAPLQNWLLYYPAEKIAAKWTDHLITINQEDYENALKLGLNKENVSLVHGVGVEFSDFSCNKENKNDLRSTFNFSAEDCVVSYIAELNDNKNHRFLLQNWEIIKKRVPQLKLLIVGTGESEEELKQYVIKKGIVDVTFLGFRRDVAQILQITDIVSLLSHREGLPKSIMEAMAASLPCVVSNTRGLRDLISHGDNGYVINHDDDQQLIESFVTLAQDEALRKRMGKIALLKVQPYLLHNVLEEYIQIYQKELNIRD